MLFKNLFLLPDTPSFTVQKIKDKNILSGAEKHRTIRIPNESMRKVHKFLIDYLRTLQALRKEISPTDGTIKKSSIRKNVLLHRYNRHFYLVDIDNAYSNVNGRKLTGILCMLDSKLNAEEFFDLLKKTCLIADKGLITGAPASPDLFNIYASILLDKPLKKLSQKYNLTYTRYRDDLLFSSKSPIGKRKRKEICKIIRTAGFEINLLKTKVYDLKKGPVVINGVGLERGGRIFLPRHFLKKSKGLIHRALEKGDISQEKIEGVMGAFWNVTDKHSDLNKTEQKLVKKYQALKQSLV